MSRSESRRERRASRKSWVVRKEPRKKEATAVTARAEERGCVTGRRVRVRVSDMLR